MKITPEDLKASYRNMSDEELLAMDRGELTDMARACYDGEMERRGLNYDAELSKAAGAEVPLVAVRTCESADEAWAVVAALNRARVPAEIGEDSRQVVVPESYAEHARDFLNPEAPETIIVEARYENGVFVPQEEIELPEGTVVEIHVPAEAFGAEES
jgi:hypothetical protein